MYGKEYSVYNRCSDLDDVGDDEQEANYDDHAPKFSVDCHSAKAEDSDL
jgi:hypothetical protein